MAVLLIDGFEHQSVSTGTGGIYSASAGSPTIDTTTKRTGAASLAVNPSASAEGLRALLSSAATGSVSLYVRFASLPSVNNSSIFRVLNSGATQGVAVTWNNTSSRLQVGFLGASFSAMDVALSTGVWYRLDVSWNVSGTSWACNAMIDGDTDNDASQSRTGTADTFDRLDYGALVGSHTWDGFIDDVVVTDSSGDYPIGAHTVEGLRVTGDGTHSTGAGSYTDHLSNALNDSTTTAYTFLDETDIASTATYIIQTTSATSSYMECTFADLASGTDVPVAVMAHSWDSDSSSSGSTPAITRVVLSDGTSVSPDLRLSTDDPGTTSTMRNKVLTAPGGGWSRTNVNGLKYRFGFGDGNPDNNHGSVILEVWMEAGPTEITGVALTTTPSLPAGRVDHSLTGVALSASPTLPAGRVDHTLTGIALAAAPSLPAGRVDHSLDGVALSASPTLPAGRIDHSIIGVALESTPTLPVGSISEGAAGQEVTGVVLEATPSLPVGRLDHSLAGVAYSVTPTLPTGGITSSVIGQAFEIVPTLPAGRLDHSIVGAALSATPAFPTAVLQTDILGTALSITPSLPIGDVQDTIMGIVLEILTQLPAGSIEHSILGAALEVTPSLPAGGLQALTQIVGEALETTPTLPPGSITHSLTGIALGASPSLPAGSVGLGLSGVALTATPTFPVGAISQIVQGVALTIVPTLPAGALQAFGTAIASEVVRMLASGEAQTVNEAIARAIMRSLASGRVT